MACSKKGIAYVWAYSEWALHVALTSSTSIQPRTMIRAHDNYILSCCVSPNNQFVPRWTVRGRILATASADRSIKLWNTTTFENITKLIGHEVGTNAGHDG